MSTSTNNISAYNNDAAIWAAAQKGMEEIRELERKGTSKAETLEDIRDMKGKTFRTADLFKLMEKYDPDAFAECSKYVKAPNGAYSKAGLSYLSSWLDKVKKGFKDGTITAEGIGKGTPKTEKNPGISAANEGKLSKKAQDFLANLRKKYGDFDFFIADKRGDYSKLAKAGSKEFSVILSSSEIERMASDEKYAREKMEGIEGAVSMSKKINEELGFASVSGKGKDGGSTISRLTIEVHDGGTMKIMAEVEKTSERQRERIEKNRAKKAEEKKADAKKVQAKKLEEMRKDSVKRTTVEASSPEELLEKIKNIDWRKVSDSHSGDKFNFTA